MLVACAVAAAAVAAVYLMGRLHAPSEPPVTTDALGPEHGESAQEYTARADRTLDEARGGDVRWALVSFPDGAAADVAAEAAGPARISEVLAGAPGQGGSAVAEVPVAAGDDGAAIVRRAQGRAADRLRGEDADTLAAAVRDGCDCVVGLVVHAPGDLLGRIAGDPAVAAVEALPGDAVYGTFAVRPMQP